MAFREVVVLSPGPAQDSEPLLLVSPPDAAAVLLNAPVTSAGAFTFANHGGRQLLWRATGPVLRLTEVALSEDLAGGTAAFAFSANVLRAVSVVEAEPHVCVTVLLADGCLFRLVFTHPNALAAHAACLANYQGHLVWSTGLSPAPAGAAAGGNVAVVASASGAVTAFVLPADQSPPRVVTLRKPPAMQRLLGFLPSMLGGGAAGAAGGAGDSSGSAPVALALTLVGTTAVVAMLAADQCLTVSTFGTEPVGAAVSAAAAGVVAPTIKQSVAAWLPEGVVLQNGVDQHRLVWSQTQRDDGGVGLRLAVAIAHADQSCVVLLDVLPSMSGKGSVQLVAVKFLLAPATDVFSTATHLWSVVENTAFVFPLQAGSVPQSPKWIAVAADADSNGTLPVVSDSQDPRQVFCAFLFSQKRFATSVLLRALHIYAPHVASAAADDLHTTIIRAVEYKIRQGALELGSIEYRQQEHACWAEFGTACVHYWRLDSAAVALSSGPTPDTVTILRNTSVSTVRPLTVAEQLLSGNMDALPLSLDAVLRADLQCLLECLTLVREALPPVVPVVDAPALPVGRAFHDLSVENASSLLHGSGALGPEVPADFATTMSHKLRAIHNVSGAVQALVNVVFSPPVQLEDDIEDWLAGQAGVLLLADTVFASAVARRTLARDLAVVVALVPRLRARAGLTGAIGIELEAALVGIDASLAADAAVCWLATSDIIDSPSFSPAAWSVLNLLLVADGVAQFADAHPLSGSLLHLALLANATYGLNVPFICIRDMAAHAAVHVANGTHLANLLLDFSQFGAVVEYARLFVHDNAAVAFLVGRAQLALGEYQKARASFLVASRAFAKQTTAAELWALVQPNENLDDAPNPSLGAFYAHVMRLFSAEVVPKFAALSDKIKPAYYACFDAPLLVCDFADRAISVITAAGAGDRSLLPMLYTNLFTSALDCGNHDRALTAMLNNPDAESRHDCLHRLVTVLCERGDARAVCEMPFSGLHTEVKTVLQTKAANSDVYAVLQRQSPNFHAVLYSFHVFRSDYRAAAAAQLAWGARLGALEREHPDPLEDDLLALVDHQRLAYAAALNALRLVDAQFAWIVLSGSEVIDTGVQSDSTVLTTFAADATMGDGWAASALGDGGAGQPIPLTLAALEKLHLRTRARCELLALRADNLLPAHMPALSSAKLRLGPLGANDAVALLAEAGLYDLAVTVARAHGLPLDGVVAALTDRAVHLSVEGEASVMAADGLWRTFNDHTLPSFDSNRCLVSAATNGGSSSSGVAAWSLLRGLLERYDSPATNFKLHTVAVERVLSMQVGAGSFALPLWLTAALTARAPAVLLALYVDHEHIPEAVQLAIDVINAQLGARKEAHGVAHALHATSQPASAWLPYTLLGRIASAAAQSRRPADKALALDFDDSLREFRARFAFYLAEAERVSNTMEQASSRNAY